MSKRTNSRYAAVKALYASEINEKIDIHKSSAELTLDIISYYHDKVEETPVELDEEFLADVVRGVLEARDDLDGKINKNLVEGWKLERLGPVIRSILRAAILELMIFTDTPFKVIINEYVNITRSFYDEKEVGFVNGVLDKISHEVR